MTYNRFFNLHIPKTGGTYFRENLLKSIESELVAKGIALNPTGNGGITNTPQTPTFHWCWFEPFITDNTFIFTTLRDPAKRIISHYAWQAVRVSAYHSDTGHPINKENFFKWFEKNKDIFKNFQSKNLIYYNQDHSIYKEAKITGWDELGLPVIDSFLFSKDFSNFSLNKEQVLQNLNRINIVSNAKDLQNMEYQIKLLKSIGNAFNVNIANDQNFTEYGNQNEHSKSLFNEFTQKELDFLYEHSNIDSEIYFSDIYTKI